MARSSPRERFHRWRTIRLPGLGRSWQGKRCRCEAGYCGRRCLTMAPSICPRRHIHTVKPLEVDIPKGRLTAVTGVSGSGKTTLILESLIPGLSAALEGKPLPPHVRGVTAEGIRQIKLIDAAPIGINVRSTVATYANVHDELRKTYAKLPLAKGTKYNSWCFFL